MITLEGFWEDPAFANSGTDLYVGAPGLAAVMETDPCGGYSGWKCPQSSQIEDTPNIDIQHFDIRRVGRGFKGTAPRGACVGDENVEFVGAFLDLSNQSLDLACLRDVCRNADCVTVPALGISSYAVEVCDSLVEALDSFGFAGCQEHLGGSGAQESFCGVEPDASGAWMKGPATVRKRVHGREKTDSEARKREECTLPPVIKAILPSMRKRDGNESLRLDIVTRASCEQQRVKSFAGRSCESEQ